MYPLVIKSFSIINLFGYKKVTIPFDEDIKIVIGENGIGKTTILNTIYYTLTRNFMKLREIDFESIEITTDTDIIVFEKEWLNYFDGTSKLAIVNTYKRLKRILSTDELKYLEDYILFGEYNSKTFVAKFKNQLNKRGIPLRMVSNDIDLLLENGFYIFTRNKIEGFEKRIISILEGYKLKYFPTYRRIEEDLTKLGLDLDTDWDEDDIEGLNEEEIIQFGMNDVEKSFKEITSKVKSNSLEGYSKVTGNMIKHLIYSNLVNDDMVSYIKENQDTLKMVLQRIGGYLNKEDREEITLLSEGEKINNQEYKHLVYFLFDLINNYNEYRQLDDSIKNFERVCNEYLVDKKIKYDESSISIGVINTLTNEPVKLSTLSSGEKQIVSILSKIYLTEHDKLIIFFDEPELSLSLEWQEKLLPHIKESKKCSFLFAVTHSPFIFNNYLDMNVSSLAEHIEVEK